MRLPLNPHPQLEADSYVNLPIVAELRTGFRLEQQTTRRLLHLLHRRWRPRR